MPSKSKNRGCLDCETPLVLKTTRDLTRKWFCSRSCRSRYHGRRKDMRPMWDKANTPEANAKKALLGERHPNWKPVGTRSRSRHGYVKIKVGEKNWPYEHRIVAKAKCGEVVHHRNEVRTDNRRRNLRKMSNTAHLRLHRAKKTGEISAIA